MSNVPRWFWWVLATCMLALTASASLNLRYLPLRFSENSEVLFDRWSRETCIPYPGIRLLCLSANSTDQTEKHPAFRLLDSLSKQPIGETSSTQHPFFAPLDSLRKQK